jgi:hypothetical protein
MLLSDLHLEQLMTSLYDSSIDLGHGNDNDRIRLCRRACFRYEIANMCLQTVPARFV